MKYLIKTVETYRLPNESEVETFLQELKQDSDFEVAKYSSTKKTVKAKGEIIDEYIQFTVTKLFNNEKEPDTMIDISYDIQGCVYNPPKSLVEDDEEEEY